MKQTFYDKFCELKNDSLDFIENFILRGRKSNFMNIDNGIKTPSGVIYRIECDSAGAYVLLLKENDSKPQPIKLMNLPHESIIKVACFLDGSAI